MVERFKEKIKKIAEEYGYDMQSRQCIEEMAELTQAVNKYWRKDLECGDLLLGVPDEYLPDVSDEYENLVEELADVQIMIWQMEFLLGVDLHIVIDEKLKRQLRRIGFDPEEEGKK